MLSADPNPHLRLTLSEGHEMCIALRDVQEIIHLDCSAPATRWEGAEYVRIRGRRVPVLPMDTPPGTPARRMVLAIVDRRLHAIPALDSRIGGGEPLRLSA